MRFVLQIEIGNDAMQTWSEIRRAVHKAVDRFAGSGFDPETDELGNKILDDNGNTVGSWKVVDDA
jgi:hypothetical protein